MMAGEKSKKSLEAKLTKKLSDVNKATSSRSRREPIEDLKNENVTDEMEKRIRNLCHEMGVPDPNEIYVIPRDFEASGNPNLTQFSIDMPDGLGRWVEEAEFEYTIGQINSHFSRAEKLDCRTVWNSICKFLTCFTIRACQRTRMERAVIRVRNFVLHQNQDVYHPKGFHIVEPAARGLRHIEFRSITYYSMKYFLEHEDDIQLSESEFQNPSKEPKNSRSPSLNPRRSVMSHQQYQSMLAEAKN